MDFAAVAELCAPRVAPETLRRIASVESRFNPYAIGVVGGRLARQPRTEAEALATTDMLAANGYDYSVGVVQVNQKNFTKYGLTRQSAFDLCDNLRAGSLILQDCLKRAGDTPHALGHALSCYYSGNFTTGYRLGYVARVENAAVADGSVVASIPVFTSKRRSSSRLAAASVVDSSPNPLFVSASSAPYGVVVSAGGNSPTQPGQSTALLF